MKRHLAKRIVAVLRRELARIQSQDSRSLSMSEELDAVDIKVILPRLDRFIQSRKVAR